MKKILVYDDYNGFLPPLEKQGIIGTITSQIGNLAPRHGWKIIEINDKNNENYGTERKQTDIEPATRTAG